MKPFTVIADAVFEAEDIDDAMRRLAMHLLIAMDEDPKVDGIITSGRLEIRPLRGSDTDDSEGDYREETK